MLNEKISIHLKKLHPSQKDVLKNSKRFNVLKIGRRWGKTTLSQDLLVNSMLDGFPVGYWAPTYKDLYQVWEELKNTLHYIITEKNETIKRIKLRTGGTIDCWSMDEPDSGRGRAYKIVVIDEAEKATRFKEAWEQAISPTLTDMRGNAWIMSTPKFGKTYFKELFNKFHNSPDWACFNLSSYLNPHLPPGEIDLARSYRDESVFRCEYLAEDIDLSDKPFFYCFDAGKHIAQNGLIINTNDTIYLSFDFNVDPITCIVAQLGGNFIHIFKEFRLRNSNLYELCAQIKAQYNNRHIIITGDASGLARHVTVKGNLNNYSIILSELGVSENQLRIPNSNPPVNESRTLCNAILARHPDVLVDSSCKFLIEDLKYLQVKEDGTVDKTSDAYRGHLSDCLRYLFNSFKHDFILKGY